MRLVVRMAAASVAAWLAAALIWRDAGPELLLGMAGPLVAAGATWMAAERTFREKPERLTGLMIAAFAAKLVFFGGYVAVVLSLPPVRPVPFVVSFTTYFIALHLTEALCLRRLFGQGMRASR
jgi:hypothetical protein